MNKAAAADGERPPNVFVAINGPPLCGLSTILRRVAQLRPDWDVRNNQSDVLGSDSAEVLRKVMCYRKPLSSTMAWLVRELDKQIQLDSLGPDDWVPTSNVVVVERSPQELALTGAALRDSGLLRRTDEKALRSLLLTVTEQFDSEDWTYSNVRVVSDPAVNVERIASGSNRPRPVGRAATKFLDRYYSLVNEFQWDSYVVTTSGQDDFEIPAALDVIAKIKDFIATAEMEQAEGYVSN